MDSRSEVQSMFYDHGLMHKSSIVLPIVIITRIGCCDHATLGISLWKVLLDAK